MKQIKPPCYRISPSARGCARTWTVEFIKPFGENGTTASDYGRYKTLKAAKAMVAHLQRKAIGLSPAKIRCRQMTETHPVCPQHSFTAPCPYCQRDALAAETTAYVDKIVAEKRELEASLASAQSRLAELAAMKPATMRQALELIAAAKDVRGCDEIARQALGITEETKVEPEICQYCGKALPEGCSREFEVEIACMGYHY